MTIRHIIKWLKSHPLISLNALEKECGIYQGLLSRAINGHQELSNKHLPALIKSLKPYGLK